MDKPFPGTPSSRLALGAAQFGQAYGLSTQHASCAPEESARILHRAAEIGIDMVDTASGYGDSEVIIGMAGLQTKIVTKTPSFDGPIGDFQLDHMKKTLERSLGRLGQPTVYGLLVHRCDNLFADGGARLMSELQALKQQAKTAKIGISAYTSQQIEMALERFAFDIVQLPMNVFDQRLLGTNILEQLRAAGVEIHVRSIFLQGVMLMNPKAIPASLDLLRPHVDQYRQAVLAAGMTPIQGAVAFVRDIVKPDRLVVGATRVSEIEEIASAFTMQASEDFDFSPFAINDPRLIDPRRWHHA